MKRVAMSLLAAESLSVTLQVEGRFEGTVVRLMEVTHEIVEFSKSIASARDNGEIA